MVEPWFPEKGPYRYMYEFEHNSFFIEFLGHMAMHTLYHFLILGLINFSSLSQYKTSCAKPHTCTDRALFLETRA